MKYWFEGMRSWLGRKKMVVHLRGGGELAIEKLAGGGYVAAPIGAMILGGEQSRELVGKYVLVVVYKDGQRGLITQEEIAKITRYGKPVPYGNPDFPGHPDFDDQSGWNHEKYITESLSKAHRHNKKKFL